MFVVGLPLKRELVVGGAGHIHRYRSSVDTKEPVIERSGVNSFLSPPARQVVPADANMTLAQPGSRDARKLNELECVADNAWVRRARCCNPGMFGGARNKHRGNDICRFESSQPSHAVALQHPN